MKSVPIELPDEPEVEEVLMAEEKLSPAKNQVKIHLKIKTGAASFISQMGQLDGRRIVSELPAV